MCVTNASPNPRRYPGDGSPGPTFLLFHAFWGEIVEKSWLSMQPIGDIEAQNICIKEKGNRNELMILCFLFFFDYF